MPTLCFLPAQPEKLDLREFLGDAVVAAVQVWWKPVLVRCLNWGRLSSSLLFFSRLALWKALFLHFPTAYSHPTKAIGQGFGNMLKVFLLRYSNSHDTGHKELAVYLTSLPVAIAFLFF